MQLNAFLVRPFVEEGLREELGPGDTTGGFLVGNDLVTEALIYAKQRGVVCGLLLAEETVKLLEPNAMVAYEVHDGDEIEPGDVLMRITAKASTLFAIERAALDWVQYLSGIATKARRYAKLVEPYGVRVTDTRKGVPGMRVLEKYAVRVGGAYNHLFGLHNAILVKDNHIKLAGGIKPAVEQLRAKALHTFKIEVECETLEEVEEALAAKADIIMFDNLDLESVDELRQLVEITHDIEGIVGYKLGVVGALRLGLRGAAQVVRDITDLPIIYDHQKAGPDIPDMAGKYISICRDAGV